MIYWVIRRGSISSVTQGHVNKEVPLYIKGEAGKANGFRQTRTWRVLVPPNRENTVVTHQTAAVANVCTSMLHK